jgi:hypothetical protein
MHPSMAKHLHSEECIEWINEYEKCNQHVNSLSFALELNSFNFLLILLFYVINF